LPDAIPIDSAYFDADRSAGLTAVAAVDPEANDDDGGVVKNDVFDTGNSS
jgi:hypothetical protein